ncbi:heterokaryon incompatibility protein-domain-containing protein [Podospora fimiseda]|uniref:Heterokaryon incompatibility protein-domain-containing protein n=1 Tax=Podospora fimiseda TaxID=252190 RepID=A0AAN6YJP1_9PEZI|nr:heterokaryon incompatibility protein-domain-containing protein [Podospora fimiseda]
MQLKVTTLPVEYVAALAPISPKDVNRINIFESFESTAKLCLLDCAVAEKKQEINGQHTTTKPEKHSKRKSRREFEKNTRKSHRETHGPAQRDKGLHRLDLSVWRPEFTWERLKESVTNGCGSCRFHHSLIVALFSVRVDLIPEALTLQWKGFEFLLSAKEKTTGRARNFQFFNPSSSTNVIRSMPSANVLCGDTSSDLSLGRALKWLHNCETLHNCGIGRQVALPRRLVDLGPGEEDYKQVLRLTETTEEMMGTYLCLSHCWGKDPMPIRTLLGNLHDHLQSLPWELLPNTFADAIRITSRLGIRYIWIDSLCIVQDSALDWQVESGKMADIYRNSYATIAAVSSADFRGGCFSSKAGDLCFEFRTEDKRSILVAVRDDEGMGQIKEEVDVEKAYPLLTRAWVYQERLLSRRILYFNHMELQLECKEGLTCECSNRRLMPHPAQSTAVGRSLNNAKVHYAKALKNFANHSLSRLECEHWHQTVSRYSKLRLTYAQDKLPALSGCAKDTARLWKDEYLGGLWRRTLAEGLLWFVDPPVIHYRPSVWRAPSWSWASVDTLKGVRFNYPQVSRFRQDFRDTIEEAKCEPAGADTTGSVSSGFIRLGRTSLCPVYLRRLCSDCFKTRIPAWIETDRWYRLTASSSSTGGRMTCKFGSEMQLAVNDGDVMGIYPDFKLDERKDYTINAESGVAADGSRCRLAPAFLLHVYDATRPQHPAVTDYFLVLRRRKGEEITEDMENNDSGEDHGEFERIGLMTVNFENGWADRNSWFSMAYTPKCTDEGVVTIV